MKFLQNIPGFRVLLILLLLGNTITCLSGQSKRQLEKERMQIIERIEYTSKLLDIKMKESLATTEDLRLLQEQTFNRKKIIDNIQNSIKLTSLQLQKQEASQDSMFRIHFAKKEGYNKLIRLNYVRMLTENRLVYLLSSNSWSESLYRIRNIRTIERYLKKQIIEMADQNKTLQASLKLIKKEKEALQQLLNEEMLNIRKLESDEALKDQLLARLEADQKKLKRDLERQRIVRESLNLEIEKTILSTLTGGRQAEMAEDTKIDRPENKEPLKLSFGKQKKMLPWPVDKGIIVSGFGRQKHPTLKDVIISNNGIDISTSPGSSVKAVFDGEIIRVIQLADDNIMVIINHGTYFTVYSKLAEVIVSPGLFVEAGQHIGKLPTDANAILHFQVWKDKTKLNPEDWLRRKYK